MKMISSGRFQPSCNSKSLLTTTSISFACKTHLGLAFFPNPSSTSSLPTTIFKNSSTLSPIQQSQHTPLCFRGAYGQRRGGSRVSALKSQRKGGAELFEMDDSDDELDGDDDLDGGDEEENDDDMLVPFGQMKKWLEKKPRGFGEGKVYDTPIEDKLLDEMEKSRQTQTENLVKLQNDPEKPNPKQDQLNNNNKAHGAAADGIRVRVLNLPKKKNIHRDLSSAFKLVPGMISINPVVSGNKKTKDPICKGFAFVHFKSEEDANRFVEMFSSQSVTFGKIQKQIKCEMVNPQPPNSAEEQSTDYYTAPQLTVSGLKPLETRTVSGLGGDQNADSDLDDSSMDAWEETVSDEDDPDDDLVEPELNEFLEKLESTSVSSLNVGDRDTMELRTESKSLQDSSLSKQIPTKSKEERVPHQKLVVKGKVKRSPKKKLIVKEKGVKAPKSIIGGSSKRLKVKEKAVLNDVFSKYGLKPALIAKEESSPGHCKSF